MSPLLLAVVPAMAELVGRDDEVGSLPRPARIGYLVAALLGTSITTSLFTYRVRTMTRAVEWRQLKPLHWLQMAVYVLGIMFSASAAITTFGVGLDGPVECRAAIILCLVFYLGQKGLLYLVLVERTHVIRARQMSRFRNWIYVTGLVVVITGFGVIAAIAFMWMVADFDPLTGECFIGLPARVALPLLTYDITVNLLLTGVFLYYVKRFLQGSLVKFFFAGDQLDSSQNPQNHGGHITLPQRKLKSIIRKTFWGCILIMPSTIANMVVLTIMKGHQAGWMCLTFCTLDVLWCTIVLHWLTSIVDDDTPLPSGNVGGSHSRSGPHRSRHRSHQPNISVMASYVKPRSSSEMDMDPSGIRREIRITQDVETVELQDIDGDKEAARISTDEL